MAVQIWDEFVIEKVAWERLYAKDNKVLLCILNIVNILNIAYPFRPKFYPL